MYLIARLHACGTLVHRLYVQVRSANRASASFLASFLSINPPGLHPRQ
jgi:hypothetical protein